MEDGRHKFASVLVTPVSGTLPPPPYSRTWGNDGVQGKSKRRGWRSKLKWKSRWHWGLHDGSISAYQTAKRTTKPVLNKTLAYSRNTWPALKKIRFTKKQSFGLFLVISCGILPLAILGYFTPRSYSPNGSSPFWGVFEDKKISCGEGMYGEPQNSTVSGIEKLFVLDNTFGRFSFSQVKMIDTLWDLFVGRGVQLLAWWAAYNVFSDALLRAIEQQPASFQIFQRIALEGPSLLSLWTLLREIWISQSRRTTALFGYMLLSTAYILCVPIFLGAMTGYDSTTIAWVDIDDSNNIVPAAMLKSSWLITGTKNATFDKIICKDYELQDQLFTIQSARFQYCDCQLPNKTIISVEQRRRQLYNDCIYNYAGNTQTYKPAWMTYGDNSPRKCNSTLDIDINGQKYDAQDLKGATGWCYNSVGYDYKSLYDKSRCLPDTANPSYQWGFATFLSGIFIILQTIWCVTMYAVWQDAQFNSTLVKSGFAMTPLRAAFVMAKAARSRTGLCEKQLVRANTKELEQELYGGKKAKGTKVEYGIFVDDPEDDGYDGDGIRRIRRRRMRLNLEPGESEVTLSSSETTQG